MSWAILKACLRHCIGNPADTTTRPIFSSFRVLIGVHRRLHSHRPSAAMTDLQRYLFDLNGFLVIEDALTAEEVAACNEAIDANQQRVAIRSGEQLLSRGSTALQGEQGRGDLGGMLTWPQPWCRPFRNLLDHRSVMPALLELLGDGFRLDHLYGIV